MAKFAAASDLLVRVLENDVGKVEAYLKLGTAPRWRELIRFEFAMTDISHPRLQNHQLLDKLMAYEIKTLSSFHAAAMLGFNDVIMALMEKDVPIDMPLSSGTTAFHLACFAGKMDTVNLLREIYKADITRRDKYGWSALHYATSEGHLKVVQSLIRLGLDVNARDQDGTTAAFRGDINGHRDVVDYLIQHGSADDLLSVDETNKYKSDEDQISALYTQSNKQPNKARMPSPPPQSKGVQFRSPVASFKSDSSINSLRSQMSNRNSTLLVENSLYNVPPTEYDEPVPVQFVGSSYSMKGTKTGKPTKTVAIRRLIRNELQKTFGEESEYETPLDVQNAMKESEIKDFVKYNIGKMTLTGLMRQEFERYKKEIAMNQAPSRPPPAAVQNKDDNEYEDLYATLANLGMAPGPPPPPGPAPALPPRNPYMPTFREDDSNLAISAQTLSLLGSAAGNAGLNQTFAMLAPMLGKNWKKLAHALPLDPDASKTDKLISQIEKTNKKNLPKQALVCFEEWVKRHEGEAHIDDIIIALRKSNLHIYIPQVERVSQEFTA